jgi:hypothetical protein
MLSAFTRGTVLLPNDDVLPTVDASTERFEVNLLPNGALLPNSAHMSVSTLYQFLVLTLGKCAPLSYVLNLLLLWVLNRCMMPTN